MEYRKVTFSSLLFLFIPFYICAQSYYVDGDGVLREKVNKKEVAFFGVNYTLPFAHAYRMHKHFGKNLKQAIDRDVYHFARLGLNAYRIHVWDVEISDKKGNLLQNEHLDLMDYLISQLKKRNIKILFTPLAYWGNGYPEKDEELDGFSAYWSKKEMTCLEEAVRAQENYLRQFVEHYNPYTGLKIKDDPDVVGFEINNEPVNNTLPVQTTLYVNRMVKAIRWSGCKKPVFYNVSHNFQNTQAFYDADIDGGTFQWYPTGLVAGHTRHGNFLPAVDKYTIPFDSIKGYDKKAKIVYEFDPADIVDSYLYPAMARSFRSAGFQWITQFAYDPMEIASTNTEYQTHFLNLAYTPQKAISMKIAAEVVKGIPRNVDWGAYPVDTVFGHFRVSYREKLSLMNSPEKFFYSNNTSARPVDEERLQEIAGCGSSPLVAYEGTGAYFLDKLANGVWRLEVMPDVVWIKDPFGKVSSKKEVAKVIWREWPMRIHIPDLGREFFYQGINEENLRKSWTEGGVVNITPGVYLLSRQRTDLEQWEAKTMHHGTIRLDEFVAPCPKTDVCDVIPVDPVWSVSADRNNVVKAMVASYEKPDSVLFFSYKEGESIWGKRPLPMKAGKGYVYEITLCSRQLNPGTLKYMILVYNKGKCYTYPSGIEGNPTDWDFYGTAAWEMRIENPSQYISLFAAAEDHMFLEPFVIGGKGYEKELCPGKHPGEWFTRVSVPKLDKRDELLLRLDLWKRVDGRRERLGMSKALCLRLGKVNAVDSLQIGFITMDGFTYKKCVSVAGEECICIPFSELKLMKTILQPEAYPAFLPDYFIPEEKECRFSVQDIDFLEISTGGICTIENPVIEIESVWIE